MAGTLPILDANAEQTVLPARLLTPEGTPPTTPSTASPTHPPLLNPTDLCSPPKKPQNVAYPTTVIPQPQNNTAPNQSLDGEHV
jgi:hypothetical protein